MVLDTNFIHCKWIIVMAFDKVGSQVGPGK